jgi:hypothetical protein
MTMFLQETKYNSALPDLSTAVQELRGIAVLGSCSLDKA